MKPTSIPLAVDIYAGDDVTFPRYQLKNAANQPIDLSGYTGWAAEWRRRATDSEELPLVVDSSEAATGYIQLSAPKEVTEVMGGNGVWDVQAIGPDGKVQTFLYGTTRWRKDVTRD